MMSDRSNSKGKLNGNFGLLESATEMYTDENASISDLKSRYGNSRMETISNLNKNLLKQNSHGRMLGMISHNSRESLQHSKEVNMLNNDSTEKLARIESI